MGVATAAGTKLYIGTTALVSATDTYIEIGEIASIAEFGRTYNPVKWSPLNSRGVQKLKGSYDEGDPVVSIGRDINDAGQAAVIVARDVDANYNFKIVANDDVPVATATVTMTVASPGVVTWTAHGLPANSPAVFTTTGALLTGLVAGTTYYVKTVLSVDTFTVSATAGGTVIAFTSTQSGVHTGTTAPVGSTQYLKAQVMSYTSGFGGPDDVVKATMTLGIKSGSLSETVHLP